MNALAAKEIRLLVPACGMGWLGAVLAGWLMPEHRWGVSMPALLPLCAGAALVALSSFGREFSLNTFGAFFAQPIQRSIIWRAKLKALVLAELTLVLIWIVVGFWAARRAGLAFHNLYEALGEGVMITAVMFAGGLWTTLLLRQVTAAFWFTILAPFPLLTVAGLVGHSDIWGYAVLGCYVVASVWWSQRHFHRMQEVPWTGAVIASPGWRSQQAAASSNVRIQQPWTALFWKEVRLHQLGLIGIGYLLLLHLVVVFLRKAGHATFPDSLRAALEAFGGIWLLVPFLVSAQTVAEERRAGTADGLTCLPVSLRVQFWLKLGFVLTLGGLLCSALLWSAELVGLLIGAGANIGGVAMSGTPGLLASLVLLFLGVSLCGFYGSTVARNVIQALAAGMITFIVLWVLAVGGLQLPLLWYVGLPVIAPALFYLSWRNFARPGESRRFMLRNCVGGPAILAFVWALTLVLFFRAWEFLMPLEPAHGPARFSLAQAPALRSYGGNTILAVLPDGRLWQQRMVYNPGVQRGFELGRTLFGTSVRAGIFVGGRWIRLAAKDTLAQGSNWVQAVANASETVAIRSDGSLWVSEHPVNTWGPPHTITVEDRYPSKVYPAAPLVRFGTQTGWKQVARYTWGEPMSVVLLRDDGSLWWWSWASRPEQPGKPAAAAAPGKIRTRYFQFTEQPEPATGLRHSEPQRLGADTDWARMMAAWSSIYVWKKDGTAWVLHAPDQESGKDRPATVVERCEAFDKMHWRGLTQMWPIQLAIHEDGTLWAWYIRRPNEPGNGNRFRLGKPVQLGTQKDWVDVAASWRRIATLRADGSLWEWDLPRNFGQDVLGAGALGQEPPRRLGKHKDWVAIAALMEGIVSVSADGNIWYWWGRNDYRGSQPLLKSSRRPEIIAQVPVGGS